MGRFTRDLPRRRATDHRPGWGTMFWLCMTMLLAGWIYSEPPKMFFPFDMKMNYPAPPEQYFPPGD